MNHLLKNWNLKLMALVLAVALWGHVRGEINPLETAMFSVRLDYSPPDKFLILNQEDLPKTVRVTIRAPRVTLREMKGGVPPNPLAPPDEALPLGPKFATASLDFSLVRTGKQEVPVKITSTPEDAEVIGSKPGVVEVELDQSAHKELEVKVVLEDTVESGWTLTRISSQPATARAFGPAGRLSKVAAIRSLAMASAFKQGQNSTQTAPLVAVDENGVVLSDIRMIPSTVRVSGRLTEEVLTKRIPLAVEVSGQPADGRRVTSVSLAPRRVQVRGSRIRLEGLQSITVNVPVGGESNGFTRNLNLELPSGITLASGQPETIRATVEMGAQPSGAGIPEDVPARLTPAPEGVTGR